MRASAKRFARVRVLISDPPRTARNGNRLVGLGRRLDTYIEFRNVHEDYREHREAFLLADDIALLWIVSRTPTMEQELLDRLNAMAKERLPNYDWSKAILDTQGSQCHYTV